MSPQTITIVVRLCAGLALVGYGAVAGAVQHFNGQTDKGFATLIIWLILGCIVAPLAEDVEDTVRRMRDDEP